MTEHHELQSILTAIKGTKMIFVKTSTFSAARVSYKEIERMFNNIIRHTYNQVKVQLESNDGTYAVIKFTDF